MKNYTIDKVASILAKKKISVDQSKHLVLIDKEDKRRDVYGNGTWGKLDFLRSQGYSITSK